MTNSTPNPTNPKSRPNGFSSRGRHLDPTLGE